MTSERVLSTAEQRRALVISSAITTFARAGYHSTTIAHVAANAGISPAYVSKLFSSKAKLFAAALGECYQRILLALEQGAESATDESPSSLLSSMGGAYANLIADRDLLMLQVHAQAAMEAEEIAAAVRQGVRDVTTYAAARTRADTREIQQFMAFGQLCHLLTNLAAFEVDEEWASILTEGIRHAAAEEVRT